MKKYSKKIKHKKMQNEKRRHMKKWISTHDDDDRYMLLARMEHDCRDFLGFGGRHEERLWALNVKEQIHYMKYIHNSFDHDKKPEWLTMEKINQYEKEMLNEDAIKTRDTFYFSRGIQACYSSSNILETEQIKKTKGEYENELENSSDLYDPIDQFKKGYIAEANRIIEINKKSRIKKSK